MADCKLLAGCPFFNDQMQGLETTKELMKQRYCRDDYSGCARFMVFSALGRPKVPADLTPNQVDRAKQIISDG
jgi:hypothetical protein